MEDKYLKTILCIFILILNLSCASTGFGPHTLIYSDHSFTLYSIGLVPTKEGQACSHSVLGLVAWGDASIKQAQSQAYVSKIFTIDLNSQSILGIYAKLCTIIKGI